jgi:hypothetical protein
LAIQATGYPRVIAASRLPTHALRQGLCDRCPGLFLGRPSSLACLSAREESEPQIKAFPYIGTSGGSYGNT